MIVASFIFGSFTTIPAGHRGVVIRFSAVTGRILDEGLQTKLPFLESVVKMSVQTQKYEANSSAVTNDLQDVSTTIALNWRLNPGMAAEVFAWKDGQVLKLFLKEWAVRSVEHEAQVAGAVHKAGLPAPAVEGIVEVEGRLGIVFERVDGPSMLQVFRSKPWRIGQLARILAELHREIHSCEMPELPSLREDLERTIREEVELPEETKEAVLMHLKQLPDGNTICHIDFHPDNILMSSHGPVVIDWANPRRGDPLADVAATSLLFRLAPLPQFMAGRWLINMFRARFHSIYLKRYLQLRPASRKQIAVWELPLITSRLSDNILEERDLLLAFIEEALSSQYWGIV